MGRAHLVRAGFAKALLDNIIHLPFIYLPIYFVYVGTFQDGSISSGIDKMRRDWLSLAASCASFWAPYDVFMFTCCPAHFRVLAMSCGALFWNTFLSSRSAKGIGAIAV